MKKLLVLALSALMLTSLVGCTSKVVAAQGVTDTEVVIANCAATSGAYAPVGVPFIAGIQAYVDKINAAGGINGRKIVFKHQDDEFDPIKGKACLSKFVNDDKVFAIVGHFGTPVVGATLQDLKDSGIPAVYFATGIGQLYADKATKDDKNWNILPVQPIYKTEGQIMVARAVGDFKAKKIGVIYTNDDAGKDLLFGAQKKATELKVELVEQQVTAGATDVSAAVTAIKNANVDFIIGAAIQATIPTIIKELAAQNVNKDLITTYVNVSPAIAKSFLDQTAGKFTVYGNGWVAIDTDHKTAIDEYVASIDAKYASNAYAMTGWIAAQFFVEGLKRVSGTVTWDKYIKAMESAPIKNPFGGTIDYANGARLGTQEMNLSKAVGTSATANWEVVKPLQSITSILAAK